MLEHRGFRTRWKEWITLLLPTSHSAVLLNGTPGEQIQHARGLRQGDPLSPYLFILAIDASAMHLETQEGILSPLRGRLAKIRLSLYADDTVIFLNPDQKEVTSLLNILNHFGAVTGLRINWAKCSVASIRCSGINLDQILQSFAGQRVSFPITYLGLPLTLGQLKVVHLQSTVDKARNRLTGWQGRTFTKPSRKRRTGAFSPKCPPNLFAHVNLARHQSN
jgi:hypothetical protein